MKYILIFSIVFLFSTNIMAQDKNELPYNEVPEYYSEYTVGTVTARMVDGLGFRYRWATEDLRVEDLKYKVSEDGRTINETMEHILGLSWIIVNSTLKESNDFTKKRPKLAYNEMRKQTLENLKKASEILREVKDLERFNMKFVSARGEQVYPFWNQINGPIEDAVWHSGQIVMMRRASGNPLNSKVSFLKGRVSK